MTQSCCKVACFLGHVSFCVEVVECGHSSKPDLSSLPISCSIISDHLLSTVSSTAKIEDNNFIRVILGLNKMGKYIFSIA